MYNMKNLQRKNNSRYRFPVNWNVMDDVTIIPVMESVIHTYIMHTQLSLSSLQYN